MKRHTLPLLLTLLMLAACEEAPAPVEPPPSATPEPGTPPAKAPPASGAPSMPGTPSFLGPSRREALARARASGWEVEVSGAEGLRLMVPFTEGCGASPIAQVVRVHAGGLSGA